MMHGSELDLLLGTNLSQEELLQRFLGAERDFLTKLFRNYEWSEEEKTMTIRALYWFRETCAYYVHLWEQGDTYTSLGQTALANEIFQPIKYNLNRGSRSCFSKENFFGQVRFLLRACEGLKVSPVSRKTYLKWLYAFPITPENSLVKVIEHELFPNNLPHVYMHRVAGFVRSKLVLRMRPKKIAGGYQTFLRELHVSRAEAQWFRTRYAGSYGSRQ